MYSSSNSTICLWVIGDWDLSCWPVVSGQCFMFTWLAGTQCQNPIAHENGLGLNFWIFEKQVGLECPNSSKVLFLTS